MPCDPEAELQPDLALLYLLRCTECPRLLWECPKSSEEWPKTFLLPRCALTICHQDANVIKGF